LRRPNFCDSGSPTAISTNTGAGVLAARRAKCAASESTASHASHPQLVEIVIRDAAGFRANSQTTEPNPLAGRAGQAPFIEILLSTPPSPTIAPLVTAQGWDDLGHAMDSGSIKDVSRLKLDVHGRSR
jgi:hypothetical protein